MIKKIVSFLPDTGNPRFAPAFLFFAAFMSFGGIIWGILSIYFGFYAVSLIPFGYTVLSIINLSLWFAHKKFSVARAFQSFISILLPFMLQWFLGGAAPSGVVMLWALLGLIALLTYYKASQVIPWYIIYVTFVLIAFYYDEELRHYASKELLDTTVQKILLEINVAVVTTMIFFLARIVMSNLEKTLEEVEVKNRELTQSEQEKEKAYQEILSREEELKQNAEELLAINTTLEERTNVIEEQSKELLNQHAVMDAMMNSNVDSVVMVDKNFSVMLANRVSLDLYTYKGRTMVIGKSFFHVVPEEQVIPCKLLFERALDGETFINEKTLEYDGFEHVYATSFFPIRSGSAEIIGVGMIDRDITAQKVYEQEIFAKSNELSQANAEMLKAQEQLKEANEVLKNSERMLEQKVEERTSELEEEKNRAEQATEEALKAKVDAERANRVKSEFLANMSHELRTPLNGILGYTQVLMSEKKLGPDHKKKVKIISESGEHLLGLINDVLDLSKIEAGRMELQPEVFNVTNFLQEIYNMFRLRAESQGISLQFETYADLPVNVYGDRGKLKQCLINIIGNAVKFTKKGGISLILEKSGDKYTFSVKDTGRGIPDDKIQEILKPFTQVYDSINTEGGTGLGLAITSNYIKLMGGELQLTSKLGVGSTFFFTIPLGAVESNETETITQRTIARIKNNEKVVILVVDDNQVNRDVAEAILGPIGFEIHMAINGKEAIERTLELKPRAVLMDIRMPVMSGLDATIELKKTEIGQKTKIIAVTASAFDQNREEFLEKGCDDYIAKPYKKESLLALIAHHIDIEYEYEDELEDYVEEETSEKVVELNFDELSKIINAETVEKFRESLMMGDFDEINDILDNLPKDNQQVQSFELKIQACVEDFNYQGITNLLDQFTH